MISVCILTKNSERSLSATLESLRKFPEVIVLDTGSKDRTISLATQFANVKVFERPFSGFGPLRNIAATLASNDWILALDSDEVLSPALQDELLSLTLEPGIVYEIDFHNFYNGKRILGCGWYPESHVRLYHRPTTRFNDTALHECVLSKHLRTHKLRHPIYHTPYRSISDFLAKMQHYSDLFAQEHAKKRPSSLTKALWHGFGAFFRSYFLKKGIFCGREGWIISTYNGHMAYYKYLKLAECIPNVIEKSVLGFSESSRD